MAIRQELLVLLVALTVVTMVGESWSSVHVPHWSHYPTINSFNMEEEMMVMETESARRNLAGKGYVSYSALVKNNVPCNQRGQSYYNCNARGQTNPYHQGCNQITRCSGQ